MQLPDYLKSYQDEAQSYLEKKLVRDIAFSGGTYQILVIDAETGKEAWTFLQLDQRGGLSDCFCDFEEVEEFAPCIHLCVAFLRIYNGWPSPLHQRFERSLWNQICRLYADRLGDEPSLLKASGKGNYVCRSVGGKVVFEIKSKTAKASTHLKSLIEHRHTDTEETSLKFSNLSQEELMQWREGHPSAQLVYELSFWNDFAKWLMLLQDAGEKYKITYGYSPKGLPNEIDIAFASIEMKFYVSEANLPLIIPSLNTVESLFKVYDAPEEEIEIITYDKKQHCLHVVPKGQLGKTLISQNRKKRKQEGIALDQWVFVALDGFYAKNRHKLLEMTTIHEDNVSQILNEHFHLIKKLLSDAQLYEDPVQVSYSMAFDLDWNLHVTCHLFSPGDLNLPGSHFFGEWAYLDDDGFYRLDGVRFPDLETVISEDMLPDFIAKNRTWLNAQEGFQTHLASVEAQLIYNLNSSNCLSFISKLSMKEEMGENKDFGPWVYIAGHGFYSKENPVTALPLHSGIVLNAERIPLFIKVNREELKLVPGFFSPTCPVERAGLDISLTENNQIQINPQYQLLPAYKEKPIRFFEEFVYVEKEGFYELPLDSRLPERYRHSVQLAPEDVDLFLSYELETLKLYAANIDPRLCKPQKMQLIVSHMDKELERAGYTLKLKYETDIGTIPVLDLWIAIKEKNRYFFSKGGLIDLDEKRFNWLRWIQKNQIDRRSHIIHLSTVELLRLHALEEIDVQKGKGKEYQKEQVLLNELVEFTAPNDPDLEGLNSSLRSYQTIGVKWLWFLYCYGLSGLLCDDMGLGKTHQTMALMAAIRNFYRKKRGDTESPAESLAEPPYFLVVCPTSVIYHWQEKLTAFLPNLRVCTFYGSDRKLDDFHQNYDILLTSYGISRIESEVLSKIPFELAIFDEIQIAKNHNSRIYSTLLTIEAKMRLGLTGTPIENNLRELKALFDIVLPFYMPSETEFRELFVKPIEKDDDPERKKLLSRMIKPFVTRRKKSDVLSDLPEKIEEVSHCDLEPEQQKLYNEILIGGRDRILKELVDESAQVPYIHIFALLSSLKQICNHPASYLKCPQKYKEYQSGKWELFVELLSEARESRQKVVVYSQYLTMLDIIEAYLSELGIGFAGIRGSTTNRGAQLQRFKQDPNCEVFVGSLQAAGLGVDLTSASVVIHYDRWWNAARENQATDRVHRIGQTKGVQVFKLVTKDTFEERTDELITRKGKLMDIVAIDDHELIKKFTREELMSFLKETHLK